MLELYVGADDSNHAGTTKGEIIVATFSTRKEDRETKTQVNRRDNCALKEWLKLGEIDFRFTLLPNDGTHHRSQNIPLVLPYLIDSYLAGAQLKRIEVYADGPINKLNERKLKGKLSRFSEEQYIQDFIKKEGDRIKFSKGPKCPNVTYMADVLANEIYVSWTPEKILQHPKFVGLPLSF